MVVGVLTIKVNRWDLQIMVASITFGGLVNLTLSGEVLDRLLDAGKLFLVLFDRNTVFTDVLLFPLDGVSNVRFHHAQGHLRFGEGSDHQNRGHEPILLNHSKYLNRKKNH